MIRYFAYGSNLNLRDLDRCCQRMGRPFAPAGRGVPAFLPDHRALFGYESGSRGGGVLDVRPSVGRLVPGALFDVTEDDLRTLDLKEGVPHIYDRAEKRVLLADGRELPAIVYQLLPENRAAGTVPPSGAYLEIVRAGYEAFGHDPGPLLAAARGETPPYLADGLFAYGTLRTGGSRHVELERAGGITGAVPAAAPGVLLDCGAFPGMLPGPGGTVHGELVGLRDPEAAFPHLDEVKGFEGFDAARALFRRGLLTVTVADGGRRLAWSYLWAGGVNHPRVPSGDWASPRGPVPPG